MIFDFMTASRIIFGSGKIGEAGILAASFGKLALVFLSSGGPDAGGLLDLLQSQGVAYEVMEVSAEPTVDLIKSGVELGRRLQIDLVIAFGGGSVLDTGKAVSAMINNPGPLEDYLEVVGKGLPVSRPALPLLAIPTTAGTGSEVTRNAVLGVPEKRVKVSLRSPHLLPKVAIIDPELTISLPASVTAATGMDALAQVLEPYVSCRANPLTDMFCREGLSRAARSLQVAYQDGNNKKAREDMAFASLMGGLALANAGLGAVHGFAAPIGGMFKAPHGAVCARLLPPVVAVNIRALRQRDPENQALVRYQEVAQLLLGTVNAKAEDGILWLEELGRNLAIPPLSQYGMQRSDFPELIEKAARASSMKGNPIVLTSEELLEILENAL